MFEEEMSNLLAVLISPYLVFKELVPADGTIMLEVWMGPNAVARSNKPMGF